MIASFIVLADILSRLEEPLEQGVGKYYNVLIEYLPSVVVALAVFAVGRWIVWRLTSFLRHSLAGRRVDHTLSAFLTNLLYWLLLVLLLVMAASIAGLPVNSVIAVLGASALAIGLALQNSLSNFAAGVMIILFHYFRVGDNIETPDAAGQVEDINIFDTRLKTGDNRLLIVPNSKIISGIVINSQAMDLRRLQLVIAIAYNADLLRAKEIIAKTLHEDPRVLAEPPALVAVGNLSDKVELFVQPWVRIADADAVKYHLLETVKLRFDAAGIDWPVVPGSLGLPAKTKN
jgi:small conductance mechanosensitive channel